MRQNFFQRQPLSYLRDWVYGGIDGAVTTFAVVAGVSGAQLSIQTILILGAANLVGDGFSMAAGNFLATRAEQDELQSFAAVEFAKMSFLRRSPWCAALTTWSAFSLCGAIPLVPFLLGFSNALVIAAILTAFVFFGIGSLKSRWSISPWWKSGFVTLFVGALASVLAFGVGFLVHEMARKDL